jgi:hypothetical protein
MKPSQTSDRADATVWLPLLSILCGIAERSLRSHEPARSHSTGQSSDDLPGRVQMPPPHPNEEGR